jgi:hypothetical protein
MATRSNPFYQYRDPNLGNMFNGIAAVMAAPARSQRDEASAAQSLALANKYRAETTGVMSKNEALQAPPAMLAELFMSGGRATDDPMLPNPKYTPDQQFGLPLDFDLSRPMPVAEYEPMFQPGRSAQDKVGMAMQEAIIRGIPAEDIAKIFAQGGYLNNVNAGNPDAGMGYMPLFGSAPTTSTALSTGRQDAMSARDADEALAQANSVARIQGQNSANVANINQAGQTARSNSRPTTGPGAKPTTTPAVAPATIKAMAGVVSDRLGSMGFKGVDARVVDGLVSEASMRYQDPNGSFKNPAAAVDSVLNDLSAGNLPGFQSATQPGGFFSRDTKSLSRTAPAPAPAPGKQDPLAAARDAIARGANRDAVIKRLKENGIDTKGL